ncbi:MAG TPA: DUF1707 domain-containing protein [Gemmatimonadaceae bacterium]|jgi:hypothetical protein|nr:DUF1707 domain-containing protein [Gemmatimonadaceae bacterium]
MTQPPRDPPSQSITPSVSPAERERVIAELSERFAHDHLTIDEFERRAAAAYAATTPAALTMLTADFQHPVAPVVARSSAPAMHIGAVLGSVVKQGIAQMPDRLDVRAIAGNVELDLTRSQFAPGITEISLRAFMGNIEIQLPPNVGLEDHVSTVLGSFEYRRQPRAASWAAASGVSSVVRFTGRVVMSSVEVVVRADDDTTGDFFNG